MYGDELYHEGASTQLYRLVLNESLNELLSGLPVEHIKDSDPNLYNAVLFKALGTNVYIEGSTANEFNPVPYYEGIPPAGTNYKLKMM